MARGRKSDPTVTLTLTEAVLSRRRPRRVTKRRNVTLGTETWAILGEMVRNEDARSRSDAIERLAKSAHEGKGDLRVRFVSPARRQAFLELCAVTGELPGALITRLVAEALVGFREHEKIPRRRPGAERAGAVRA